MQHLEIGTGSPSTWWGRKEHTEFVNVPLMIGIRVSHNFGILASKGNPVSCVQAGGNSNRFSTLAG